ncbi:hypothetical protein PIB30_060179 [Stylosanthes scabra]|uniref:Uncharacterized protein n=1 Tax=Stylosanthes scabra TaxID=79078 RepID=A0ABU6SKH7_9FABA|nr:hypothetical protein [Stylosanthes scabra]
MPSSNDKEAWKKGGRPKNPDGPKLKSLDSRCSPSGLKKIMIEIEQDNLKMAEVINMGFHDFQHIPDWFVKQELFLHLASRFDLENNLIKDDVGSIEVDVSVVERSIGLPSYGANFLEYDPDDIHTAALKLRWGPMTLTKLKSFVTTCPMNSNEARREFREGFILLLAKIFLCPTTNKFISPERYLPLVLDVVNTRKYNWSLQIFTWIKDSIRNSKERVLNTFLVACLYLL